MLCLCFAGISNGQSTVCFDLHITDNCSGEWNGKYAARVSVRYLGNDYCQSTIYNLDAGWNYNQGYTCTDLPVDYYTPVYYIYVTVCRQEEDPTCCDTEFIGPMNYNKLSDCDNQILVSLTD